MEEKILGLYACGMSQRNTSEQIKNLYDVDISPELVSKISEMIFPQKNVRFIAINDGVDSAQGENDFAPLRPCL